MPLHVSYMGTKRSIAPLVSEVVSNGPSGPLLDLFSGMCAVGSEVGVSRPIWNNDIQHFAASVARAFFTSNEFPLQPEDAADLVYKLYKRNYNALEKRFCNELYLEKDALQSGTISKIHKLSSLIPNINNSHKLNVERIRLSKKSNTFPYRLFSITYAGGYIGLQQSLQVDSIRFALDKLLSEKLISLDQFRWMILALCQAICRASTTTGHFAQFIKINKNNKNRFLKNRNKSIWFLWLDSFGQLAPVGSSRWRSKNKVFNCDSLRLLKELKKEHEIPSIIYADPPYTSDQYSRYYHLYETLILYDYPSSSGEGRYRPDRFSSGFSLKTKVIQSFTDLIESSSKLSSQLVLSYPENGLLPNAKSTLLSIFNVYYDNVTVVHSVDHYHSTLGASKGPGKQPVKELVFWAR